MVVFRSGLRLSLNGMEMEMEMVDFRSWSNFWFLLMYCRSFTKVDLKRKICALLLCHCNSLSSCVSKFEICRSFSSIFAKWYEDVIPCSLRFLHSSQCVEMLFLLVPFLFSSQLLEIHWTLELIWVEIELSSDNFLDFDRNSNSMWRCLVFELLARSPWLHAIEVVACLLHSSKKCHMHHKIVGSLGVGPTYVLRCWSQLSVRRKQRNPKKIQVREKRDTFEMREKWRFTGQGVPRNLYGSLSYLGPNLDPIKPN